MIRFGLIALVLALIISCTEKKSFDVVIRGGTIYDGSGGDPVVADIAINSDTIAAIGDLSNAVGKSEVDAKGLSVAPGFINMLSWAPESLIVDGKSQGDIRQGVTLEVFGEGSSMGPINEEMKKGMRSQMRDFSYDIAWTTLGEYLDHMEKRGISCNIASFVGSGTLRIHELGMANRRPI